MLVEKKVKKYLTTVGHSMRALFRHRHHIIWFSCDSGFQIIQVFIGFHHHILCFFPMIQVFMWFCHQIDASERKQWNVEEESPYFTDTIQIKLHKYNCTNSNGSPMWESPYFTGILLTPVRLSARWTPVRWVDLKYSMFMFLYVYSYFDAGNCHILWLFWGNFNLFQSVQTMLSWVKANP